MMQRNLAQKSPTKILKEETTYFKQQLVILDTEEMNATINTLESKPTQQTTLEIFGSYILATQPS